MTDSWPRTGRWLPWMLAGLLSLLWLLPTDSITPRVDTPVDLKLDRVGLMAIAFVWVALVCAGGRTAPRLRGLGAVGLAVVAFYLVALYSVTFDIKTIMVAHQTGIATKKLFLLASYASLFLIVATSLRSDEVRPFARLFMWLGVLAALLVVYDRFIGDNPFFSLAGLLPQGAFALRPIDTSPFDPNPITGPTRHGLAIAAMLSMVVPFAMAELLASRGRRRLLYGGLVALLILAVWATNRKTGVYASLAALGTLALLRPREMFVRVLPVAFIALCLVAAIKPAAVGLQLKRISPGTVTTGLSSQGRSADYPAIVPDFRAHPLLGRGYGTYEPDRFRILDNNYLGLLLETGAIGLAAFVAMILSVWGTAIRGLRSMGAARAGPLLAVSAATSAFAVSMALFDAMSFVPVPYFFFFLAGLLAAARWPAADDGAVAVGAPGRELPLRGPPRASPAGG